MNTYWSNLIAWSLQVAIVGAAGALLPFVFRLRVARARLWYSHVVLLACLALPVLQPWIRPAPIHSAITFTTGQYRLVGNGAPPSLAISWPAATFILLAAGVALRLLWLGIGLLRLRRYRLTAIPLAPHDDHFTDLRRSIAPQAEILVSNRINSPVTFGVWSAVVLLPERFHNLGLDERRSIVCHELIHIHRRDWAMAIAEELVRSVLWFHPAVWWILGQIHLTREQVVDEAVIQHTGDRNRYLDALLAIASLRLSADLAPAPLFLKKRHLRQRVESIVSGVTMTKRNLLFPLAAAFATLPVVIGIAAWQFPLRAAPDEAVDDSGVQVDMGGARVLHRTGIAFPEEARAKHRSGTVVTDVSVDSKGEVIDARVVSGPDEFRKPVVQSVLTWHFSLDSPSDPRNFQVAVRFDGGQAPPPSPGGEGTLVPPSAADTPRTIDSINMASLPQALQDKVTQAGILHVGDVLTRDTFKTTEASLRSIDDHLRLTGVLTGDKVHVMLHLDNGTLRPRKGVAPVPPKAPAATPMASLATPASTGAPQSIRVGGNVQQANLIYQVRPVYPPDAKAARIQGTVKLNVTIAPDGTVKDIQVASGQPLLVAAALPAVKEWVYKPTLLNGNPVEVITTVDVNFTLSQ